jgi:hypothetical protein
MSKSRSSESEPREPVIDIARRTMLEQFALGGAALAAIGLGSVALATPIEAAPASASCENLQPIAAGKIRRVVCGVNSAGKGRVVSDTVIPTGILWTTDGQHPLGASPADERPYVSAPSELRSRWYIAALKPNAEPKPTLENRQGFHINPVRGITYVFVLTGSITYLTDLQEVKLNAGDLLIMRDNAHSWRNDGTEPVNILVAALAA